MSFFGKVYTYQGEEKFGDFLRAVGLPETEVNKLLQAKPTAKIEKDGDGYIFTTVTPSGEKPTKFQSGVEFEDFIKGDIPIKSTYTVDGNKVTQSIKTEKGSATFAREFNDDSLVVTITSSAWDGTAKTFYKA